METIFRGDKVVLVKEYDRMKQVGQTFEIGDITNQAVVIRTEDTRVAVGAISIDDFENYFVKKENIVVGWTKWYRLIDTMGNVIGFYRTNFKKVQVKVNHTDGCFVGEASCNSNVDEFNLQFGITLAYKRCHNKKLKSFINNCNDTIKALQNEINNAGNEIAVNDNTIERMIKSLNQNKS